MNHFIAGGGLEVEQQTLFAQEKHDLALLAAMVAQVVEQSSAELEDAGSNPVGRIVHRCLKGEISSLTMCLSFGDNCCLYLISSQVGCRDRKCPLS